MEALRNPASSLFEFVYKLDSSRVFSNSLRSLLVISHEIEDAVINGDIRTRIFAGFQQMSLFIPQVERYQQLARVAERIWIFGVQDIEPPPIPNVVYVPLAPTDRLAQEWFVVADAPEYFSALTARNERDSQAHERHYRGIWTFDPEIVRQADRWLSRSVGVVEADIDLTGRNYSRQLNQIGHTVENLINNLELRNAELQRNQALTQTLIDMIVHDINNPLAVVLSSLDLIDIALTRGKPETVTKYTQNAKENVQQAVGLITDLLEVSRMEAGELKFQLQPVEVSEIIEAIMGRFDGMAKLQGKQLTAEVTARLRVYGDVEMLVRVLANLVGNAFKFTSTDGLIAISAKPSPDAQFVIIAVADNGTGIARDQQQYIFEKFGQVQGRGNARVGFGLGLTFCRMCIEAHGGKISVDSEEGKGATFQFTLRAAPTIRERESTH